jgi:hypothetical protein
VVGKQNEEGDRREMRDMTDKTQVGRTAGEERKGKMQTGGREMEIKSV